MKKAIIKQLVSGILFLVTVFIAWIVVSKVVPAIFIEAGNKIIEQSQNRTQSANKNTNSASPSLGEHEKEQSEKKVRKNGVEMTIRIRRDNIVAQPLPLQISLTNYGDQSFSHGHSRSYDNYEISVFNIFGKQVPLTDFGQSCVASREGGKLGISDIEPGWSYSVTLNLLRLFDLTIPGKYHVSVSKQINPFQPQEYYIKVTGLEFTVSEEEIVHTKTKNKTAP